MGAKAHGRIVFWEGASLWIFSAPPGVQYPRTDPHSHHVVQVALALTGRVELTDDAGVRVEGGAVAIAPDSTHAFEGTGLVAHLFVAPESRAGRAIVRGLFANGPMTPIPAPYLGDLPARLRATFEAPRRTDDALRALGRALIARLARTDLDADPPDPRIAALLVWMAAHLDETVSLGEAAARTGLSPGRLRHLFVQQTGLPFRTYLLWIRLVRAVELFAGGKSLTEAAHGAGFSDSAHLSRTFHRMFGIVAASLQLS